MVKRYNRRSAPESLERRPIDKRPITDCGSVARSSSVVFKCHFTPVAGFLKCCVMMMGVLGQNQPQVWLLRYGASSHASGAAASVSTTNT
jgi:hypothetical protein